MPFAPVFTTSGNVSSCVDHFVEKEDGESESEIIHMSSRQTPVAYLSLQMKTGLEVESRPNCS